MGKQPVTIYDIAFRAKVSQSTVSRVLSGSTRVSAEKRAAVLAAVEALNYQPNVVARGLARGRSQVIGVLTLERVSPVFSQVLVGVERGLRQTGYHPLTASVVGHEDTGRAIDTLVASRVDALIVVGAAIVDERLERVAKEMPIAAVGPTMAALTERSIHADNETGAYAAVKYLVDLGHRRIAHVTGPSAHLHVIARRQGYTRALSDAGIALDPALVVEARWDEESGKEAIETLSQRAEFSAIFAGNDQIAYGAQLALFERGLRVPEDVSLVGFDDQPHSAYTTPPLTTVRQPVEEMGSAAARALVAVLAGEPWSVPKFSTELVVRASAAPPAAGRARLAKR